MQASGTSLTALHTGPPAKLVHSRCGHGKGPPLLTSPGSPEQRQRRAGEMEAGVKEPLHLKLGHKASLEHRAVHLVPQTRGTLWSLELWITLEGGVKFKVQSIWEGSHQSLPAPVNLASAERLMKRMCLLCRWPWVGSAARWEPPCPQVWQISLGMEQQWAGAALPDAVARSRDLGQLRLPSGHCNSAFLIFSSSHLESKEKELFAVVSPLAKMASHDPQGF